MRHSILIAVLLAAASCGGTSQEEDSTTDVAAVDLMTPDLQTGDETTPELFLPDAAPDSEAQPLPVPPTPLPELAVGLYSFDDGSNRMTLVYSGERFFLLESSFACEGASGCKIRQEFSRLSCNQSFEKGYTTGMTEGVLSLSGIKDTDSLYGAVQATDRISAVYTLTPPVECCQEEFRFDLVWDDDEDCADFAAPDCVIYTDENCEEGYNCILNAVETPQCVLEGSTAVGETCNTQISCIDGVCMALGADTKNHCYRYCQTDSDCGWNSNCLGITGKAWKVCSLSQDEYESCDLLEQACAKPGEACYIVSSPTGQPICMPVGDTAAGDPCSTSSDCQKGNDCVGGSLCRKLCNTEGGEPSCESAFDSCVTIVPWQDAGYCSGT